MASWLELRILTYLKREVSQYGRSPVYFKYLDSAVLLLLNEQQSLLVYLFTCLLQSKPVKQEVSHSVILTLMDSVGATTQFVHT